MNRLLVKIKFIFCLLLLSYASPTTSLHKKTTTSHNFIAESTILQNDYSAVLGDGQRLLAELKNSIKQNYTDNEKLKSLLLQASKLFIQQRTALKTHQNQTLVKQLDLTNIPNAELKMFTDIHSNLEPLITIIDTLNNENWLGKNGDPFKINKENGYLVFLGDATDRGNNGVQVWIILLNLYLRNPGRVILIRGNHEDIYINYRYGFTDELKK